MNTIDKEDDWHEPAVNAREALRLLGFPVLMEQCLKGEPGYMHCMASDSLHAIGYFAVIKATVEHHLGHVTDPALKRAVDEIHQEAAQTMAKNCDAV
jgi:hypothetical protein